jgi:hypothetical protein
MTDKKLPTPEQTRERLLGEITKILEGGDPYAAPEVLMPWRRSMLYAMMLEEFNTFARFHGDAIAKLQVALNVPLTSGVNEMVAKVMHLRRQAAS